MFFQSTALLLAVLLFKCAFFSFSDISALLLPAKKANLRSFSVLSALFVGKNCFSIN